VNYNERNYRLLLIAVKNINHMQVRSFSNLEPFSLGCSYCSCFKIKWENSSLWWF